MKISQKRTCNGCRAEKAYDFHRGCELGYKTEPCNPLALVCLEQKPLEACPKPITVMEYHDATLNYKASLVREDQPK